MSQRGAPSTSWKIGLSSCGLPRAASSWLAMAATRRLRIDRLAGAVGLVGEAAHQRDVERQHGAFAEHDHRAARPHRVADAELVEHVGVGAGDVGHGVVAQHQPLEHRLVDGAADLLLVGADRLEPGALDRRRDDLGVDGVEIGDAPGRVHLLAERHQHEAERGELNRLVHGHPFSLPG